MKASHAFMSQLINELRQDLSATYDNLRPSVAKQLSISDSALRDKLKLQLEVSLRISAESQTREDTITISLGFVTFLQYIIALFVSNFGKDLGKRHFSGVQARRHEKLRDEFMLGFWEGGGDEVTDRMEAAWIDIVKEFLDPFHLWFHSRAVVYALHFVLAHEMGHLVYRQKHDVGEEIPYKDVADYFIRGLADEGLIDQFATRAGTSPDAIRKHWVEELCVDGMGLDFCKSLPLEQKDLGCMLLSPRELSSLPERMVSKYCNAYALLISTDIFFTTRHLLDIALARSFRGMLPFDTHPPTVTRLAFARCIFKPPNIQMTKSSGSDGPITMVSLSSFLFEEEQDVLHPIALSRLPNQSSNQAMMRRLCEYLKYSYSGDADEAGPLKLSDVVDATDPIFGRDRLITFSNHLTDVTDALVHETS